MGSVQVRDPPPGHTLHLLPAKPTPAYIESTSKIPSVWLWPSISNVIVSRVSTKVGMRVLLKKLPSNCQLHQNRLWDSRTVHAGVQQFLPDTCTSCRWIWGTSVRRIATWCRVTPAGSVTNPSGERRTALTAERLFVSVLANLVSDFGEIRYSWSTCYSQIRHLSTSFLCQRPQIFWTVNAS